MIGPRTSTPPFTMAAIGDEAPRRGLALHADDFGMNDAVTGGILEAFRDGLLTSASVLANAPGCSRGLVQWKELQSSFAQGDLPSCAARRRLGDSRAPFDLGIHLNLTQGRPLTADGYPPQLLDRQGLFPGVSGLFRRLLVHGRRFRLEIERELRAQIEVLLDHGIAPTHLNAHQYVDLLPVVAELTPALLARYAIPVVRVPWERHLTRSTLTTRFEPIVWSLGQVKRVFAFRYLLDMRRRGAAHPAAYFGTSHAGRIDLERMLIFASALGAGLSEIGMHPGLAPATGPCEPAPDGWHDPLAELRTRELSLLTSPELELLLEMRHIRLGRLSELALRPALPIAA